MYRLVALCNRIHLQPNALRMRHILTQSQLVCHSFMCHETLFHCNCWRPYHVECTGSLLTSEVKRHRARLVLGWGTAWEDLRVLPASSIQQGQRSRAGEERGWGRRRRREERGGGGGEGEKEEEEEEEEAEAEAEAEACPLPLCLCLCLYRL